MTGFGEDSKELQLIVELAKGANVAEVASRLRAAGFLVERELPLTGLIGLRVPRCRLQRLRTVEGVRNVRAEGGYQLPPFDERFPQ